METNIFVQTTGDNYGLIRLDNQLHNNPPEFSQTIYNSKYVHNRLPLEQNYGLVNTASDGYGLMTPENMAHNNPSTTTGYSKMVLVPKYVVYEGPNVHVQNSSYSLV